MNYNIVVDSILQQWRSVQKDLLETCNNTISLKDDSLHIPHFHLVFHYFYLVWFV